MLACLLHTAADPASIVICVCGVSQSLHRSIATQSCATLWPRHADLPQPAELHNRVATVVQQRQREVAEVNETLKRLQGEVGAALGEWLGRGCGAGLDAAWPQTVQAAIYLVMFIQPPCRLS